jgi:hypothetical protein
MVEWRGLSSKKLKVFAVGDPWIFCLIAQVVRSMRGLFDDEEAL